MSPGWALCSVHPAWHPLPLLAPQTFPRGTRESPHPPLPERHSPRCSPGAEGGRVAPTRMGLTPARCCPHPSRAISEVRGGGVLPRVAPHSHGPLPARPGLSPRTRGCARLPLTPRPALTVPYYTCHLAGHPALPPCSPRLPVLSHGKPCPGRRQPSCRSMPTHPFQATLPAEGTLFICCLLREVPLWRKVPSNWYFPYCWINHCSCFYVP